MLSSRRRLFEIGIGTNLEHEPMGRTKKSAAVASTTLTRADATVRQSKRGRPGVKSGSSAKISALPMATNAKNSKPRRKKQPPNQDAPVTKTEAAERTRTRTQARASVIKPPQSGNIASHSIKATSVVEKRIKLARGERAGARTGSAAAKNERQPDGKLGRRGRGTKRRRMVGEASSGVRGQGERRVRRRQSKREDDVKEVEGEAEPDGESGSLALSERGGVVALVESHDERLPNPNHELNEVIGVKDESTLDAVVKVLCVHTEPNFSLPWQRKRQYR